MELLLTYVSTSDVNKADRYGNTPLHLACEEGSRPAVLLLLKYGARNDIQNKESKIPSQLCKERALAKLVAGEEWRAALIR